MDTAASGKCRHLSSPRAGLACQRKLFLLSRLWRFSLAAGLRRELDAESELDRTRAAAAAAAGYLPRSELGSFRQLSAGSVLRLPMSDVLAAAVGSRFEPSAAGGLGGGSGGSFLERTEADEDKGRPSPPPPSPPPPPPPGTEPLSAPQGCGWWSRVAVGLREPSQAAAQA